MSTNGKFKKSMFGFNKASVLEYVEAIQKENFEETSRLNAELSDYKTKYEDAVKINNELNEKVAECEASLIELKNMADSLMAEVEKNQQLHSQIGEVYVEAKAYAIKIVNQADKNAKDMLSSADKSASFTIDQINTTRDDLGKLQRSLEQSVSEFAKKLSQIDSTLKVAKSKLASKNKLNTGISDDDLVARGIIK